MRSLAVQLVCLLIIASVFSAVPAWSEEKNELPKSGSLAGSLVSGADSKAVSEPWGGAAIADGGPAPVSGSISKVNARQWQMKLFNNSADRYNVDIEVVQYGQRSTKVRSDFYSYSLEPGRGVERMVPTNDTVSQCEVQLKRWKKFEIKKEKTADQGAGTPAAEQSQVKQ